MKHAFVLILTLGLISLVPIQNADALTKVARDMNFLTVYAGTSSPVGNQNGIPGDPFIFGPNRYSFDGNDVYDNALYLGFDYGKLISNSISFSVGFRYINHQLKDTIGNETFSFSDVPPNNINQYDIWAEHQYRLSDIKQVNFTPYVGVSLFTGFTTLDNGGLENQNRVTVAMGALFGAEFKIMENPANKNFMTLVSANSYNFMASGNRPKYLHLGAALRFYFNN